jgi:hypothetical protein
MLIPKSIFNFIFIAEMLIPKSVFNHTFIAQMLIPKSIFNLTFKAQMLFYSVALVRERTIPTERPPLVDEI